MIQSTSHPWFDNDLTWFEIENNKSVAKKKKKTGIESHPHRESHQVGPKIYSWLVVWNMAFIFPYIGGKVNKRLSYFFRGVGIPPMEHGDAWNIFYHKVIFNTPPTAKQPPTATSQCLDIFCFVHCFRLPEGEAEESLDLKANFQSDHSSKDIETDGDKDR